MNVKQSPKKNSYLLIAAAFLVLPQVQATDISTEPLNTYSAGSSTDVKPNVLFILDDSGSMDWDFMPDWACAPTSLQNSSCSSTGQDPSSPRWEYLFRNAAYNGVYYNPAVNYKAPIAVASDGTTNTTTYPRMAGASAATGADSSTKPNWKAVKDDAYNVQSTGTSNLTDGSRPATYFTIVAGEYCKEPSLRTCISANAPSETHPYPATIRWCDSSALTNCRATFSPTFSWVRAPSPRTSRITITGSNSTSVSGITVGSEQIMAATASATTDANTLAQRIVDQINQCTVNKVGNCTVVGYSAHRIERRNSSNYGVTYGPWYPVSSCSTDSDGATRNECRGGNVVTITAPKVVDATPDISKSGNMTIAASAFEQGAVRGEVLRTSITSTTTSYPYPGTEEKASSRTDCAGTTCTYDEEMTNYANWWTYYRTRMQTMKTATSNAFSAIDKASDIANDVSRFRLGFLSLNNNTGEDFQNLAEFKGANKHNWYTKLIGADPSSGTPLREALAKAGRLYAGRLNGTTLNGVTVTDPLQYSCQQNYTILSSDGFWNGNDGFKLDGTTAVGNQDAAMPRPYNDGGTARIQARTKTLQARTLTPQLQRRTSALQSRTTTNVSAPPILARTSSTSGWLWTDWVEVSSCSPDNSGPDRRQCQFPKATSTDSGASWTGWSYASSCSTDTSGPTRTKCSGTIPVVSAWQDTNSCTSGNDTECRYNGWTAWANTDSCTAQAQSGSSPYAGPAVQCQTVNTTGVWTDASSCTESSTKNCQYTSWSAWFDVSSCNAVQPSVGPEYTVATARECQGLPNGGTSDTLADVAAYYYNTDLRNPDAAAGTGTCDGPTIAPATTPNNLCDNNVPSNGKDVADTQHMTTFTLGLGAQGQMLAPKQREDYWSAKSGDFYDVMNGSTANPASGICSWQTSGVCNWPTPASNSNANIDDLWHAAVNGRGSYFSASDPQTLAEGLTNTLQAISNTPRPGTAAAAASSNPNVSASDNYVFSSSYKSVEWYGELIRQRIDSATGKLSRQNWSAMRLLDCTTTPWTASTSYSAGDAFRYSNTCYVVKNAYVSGTEFEGSTGGLDRSNTAVVNVDETASPKVPVTAQTSRTIFTKGSSGPVSFEWSALEDAGLDTYFKKPAISGLSQFCASGAACLTAAAQDNTTVAAGGAAGEALVNYLRGDRSNENTFFRKRNHVLGDIVSSEARYVKVPMFNYTDANYSAYKTLKASRTGTVYVGSNDGMLHAFDAESGQERWAYIPSFVLPNLYKLADKNYKTQHEYFVDGTPETGDICPNAPVSTCTAAQWKTILVGGLNRGGKGYYALDVTDPSSPSILWEFSDANMGYSYGNPRITKLKNGTWVVILTSGYNNADGEGRIYILNAHTGALIREISTEVGEADSPSGLARISAHVRYPMTNNTVTAVYGGDEFGNLWRFDVNGDIGATGYDAHRLVSFTKSNVAQPITVKPLEATVNGKPIVFVGTGRYLGTTDVSNTRVQSFYAIKDKLDATTYGDPRAANSGFVQQTLTSEKCPNNTPTSICTPGQIVRISTSNAVNWTDDNGWYFDFLTGGERSVTDPSLALGTLLFTTITPNQSSVSACGDPAGNASSFMYALNYLTGGPVDGAAGVSAMSLGAGLVTRPVMIRHTDGTVRALIRTTGTIESTIDTGIDSGAGNVGDGVPVPGGEDEGVGETDNGGTEVLTPPIKGGAGGVVRRVSWRELTSQ